MKQTTGILFLAITLFLVSCGGGGGKFTGKWRDVSREDGQIMIIKQQGKSYDMFPENSPADFMAFTYDSDRDILTASEGNNIMDIRYDKENKLLTIGPRGDGWGRKMTLVKVKK